MMSKITICCKKQIEKSINVTNNNSSRDLNNLLSHRRESFTFTTNYVNLNIIEVVIYLCNACVR